jgi:hypothetical protein
VIGAGIGTKLRDHYKEASLKVSYSFDPNLASTIEMSTRESLSQNGVDVYLYQNGKLVDRSSSFDNPYIRHLLEDLADVP